MDLVFADSQKNIGVDLSTFEPELFFIGARIEAKSHNRVIEVKGQCFHCGTIQKPVSEMSFDETFSWCCEAAERESILVHQSRHKCDLCGKYSPNSETHSKCADIENAVADFETAWTQTF